MQLYFSPMSCSLATRIALYEAGADAQFIQVDTKTKRMADGANYLQVNPLGQVPTLRLEDGSLLTENAAILQFVARRYPEAELAPTAPAEVCRLQQWLSFIGTELHKHVFTPLLDPAAPAPAKAYALSQAPSRLQIVATRLQAHDYLLEQFTVADAYLTVILGWTAATPVKLDPWPSLFAYLKRVRARPHVQRAMAEERTLYLGEQAPAAGS